MPHMPCCMQPVVVHTLLVCCQFCKRKSRIRRVGSTTLSERAKMQNAQRTKMIANQIGKYNYQVDWPDLPVQWSGSLTVWQSVRFSGHFNWIFGRFISCFFIAISLTIGQQFPKISHYDFHFRCAMCSSCGRYRLS